MFKYLLGGTAFGLSMLLWSANASATILEFGGAGQTTNSIIPQTFGDFVSAAGPGISVANGTTPNIDLSWTGSGPVTPPPWEFYNDGTWIAAQLNSETTQSPYFLTFTPDSGFGVLVDSFKYHNYPTWQGGAVFHWALLKDSNAGAVIASANNVAVTDGQKLQINTGMASPYFGAVVLRITIGTDPDTLGTSDAALDDISFTQAVPEPASCLLFATGIIGLSVFGYRRRK